MHKSVQNDLIVIGLPSYICNKLDREVIMSLDKLMMKLTKIDYPNKQKGGIQKNVVNPLMLNKSQQNNLGKNRLQTVFYLC